MLAIDPLRLARRQLELDRERTRRYPHLLQHKAERMSASPLALLRGAAPLFYELLDAHPSAEPVHLGVPVKFPDGWEAHQAFMAHLARHRVCAA